MKALADAGAHVSVKLSMLCYTDPNWDKPGSRVMELTKLILSMFGPERYEWHRVDADIV